MSGSSDHRLSGNQYTMVSIKVLVKHQLKHLKEVNSKLSLSLGSQGLLSPSEDVDRSKPMSIT